MTRKTGVLGMALLMAAPAWPGGGGHGGGFRGSGGQATVAPRAAASADIAARGMAPGPRAAGGTLTGSDSVRLPATPARGVEHLPMGTLNSRSAPAPTRAHVTVSWTTSATRITTAANSRSTQPAPRSGFIATPTPRHPLVGVHVFFRRPTVFISVGDDFSPFFFETVAFDPFLVDPFCPLCATGRIPKFNVLSPFVCRRFFFDGFSPCGFLPAFGSAFATSVFPGGEPEMAAPAEQVLAGEGEPDVAGMPAVEAAPLSPGAEQPAAHPITLLFLKNGWMGGLTDYWVEDGRLRYMTSHGGEDSVPLDRIDFGRTVQINAERGVEFVLRAKPWSR